MIHIIIIIKCSFKHFQMFLQSTPFLCLPLKRPSCYIKLLLRGLCCRNKFSFTLISSDLEKCSRRHMLFSPRGPNRSMGEPCKQGFLAAITCFFAEKQLCKEAEGFFFFSLNDCLILCTCHRSAPGDSK